MTTTALDRRPVASTAADACAGAARAASALQVLLDHPESWAAHLGRLEALRAGRWYTPVLDTPTANGWLILWTPSSDIAEHGHGASAASVAVVAGELVERYRDERTSALQRRRLRSGRTVTFGPAHLHAITNASTRPAASLHVYSPPLETMHWTPPHRDGAPAGVAPATR